MIIDKATFFNQLSKSSTLADNLLSIILAKHPDLDTSSRESYFDKLAPFYKRYTLPDRESISESDSSDVSEITEWQGLDLRIENVKLQSVRGFPPSQIPFGIDFSNDQKEPQSMVILGANAFGKSSIYDAIEYSFCRKIGETQLRTSQELKDGSVEFETYLQHFDNPFINSRCSVKLKCEKFFEITQENIPKSVRRKINPNSHFISDFDIYSNGRLNFRGNSNDSFQNLIATSLGLSELLQKEKELFAFAGYGRKIETNRKANLEREIKNSADIIGRNKQSVEEKTKLLSQLQQGEVATDQTQYIQSVLQLVQQLRSTQFSFEYKQEELLNIATQFSNLYDDFVSVSEKTKGLNQIQFLNEGLKFLQEEQSCPICNDSKLETDEIKKHLEVKIQQLEKFNKLSVELTRVSNNLTNSLSDLSSKIVTLRGKATYDLSLTHDREEFNQLSISTNEFLSYLNEMYSQDIFSKIPTIDANDISVAAKLNHQKEIISNYSAFLSDKLKTYVETIPKFETKRQEQINAIEAQAKSKLQVNSKEGEIAILKNEIQQLQSQTVAEQKSIEAKKPELVAATEAVELYAQIKSETRKFANEFHRELANEIKGAFEPIQKIVKEILDKYLYIENRPATLKFEMKPESWDEETGEVISEIITAYIEPLDKTQSSQEVNKYFNTFHYRLFCTMVGISIAVASRKNTGINLPLVLDDVFYASDFENRTTIEEFITKLFELFKEFTPDKELQLILFTHDQLIFESIIKTTTTKDIENILFAKLFRHEEAELEGDFKNLVYRLPAYIPYSHTQTTLTAE
ncbi:MAG: hypothetical protein K9G46_02985 [Flavobacteriales bacterium]|nr:hypothetical protein [Flavobacteriales bacterium]